MSITEGGSAGKGLSSRDANLYPTRAILQDYLGNGSRLAEILSRNPQTLGAVRQRIARLEGGLPFQLFGDLLDVVGTHSSQHTRRGAMILLESTPVDSVAPVEVLSTYLGTVRDVAADNIGGLLRVGVTLAPHFVDEQGLSVTDVTRIRLNIGRTWMSVAAGTEDHDIWQSIAIGAFDIQHGFHVNSVKDPEPVTLERRRMILELCDPTLTKKELDLALAENGYVTKSGELTKDLHYLASYGIDVPLALPPETPTNS